MLKQRKLYKWIDGALLALLLLDGGGGIAPALAQGSGYLPTVTIVQELAPRRALSDGGQQVITEGSVAAAAAPQWQSYIVHTTAEDVMVTAEVCGDAAQAAFELANAQRLAYGLPALQYDETLQLAAEQRAAEASLSWSHTRPDGSDWNTVAANINGENLAFGYADAAAVTVGWEQSAGHLENLLRVNYQRTALAALKIDGTMYWVQLFGN